VEKKMGLESVIEIAVGKEESCSKKLQQGRKKVVVRNCSKEGRKLL
jgi:hypothetical protein